MTDPDKTDDFTADPHRDLDAGEFGMMADADYYDRIASAPAKTAETGPAHNDHCCMEGAWPGWGPHPDCPGVEALSGAEWKP